MVSTQFGSVLKEFEKFFNCSLNPDENNACVIHTPLGVILNIEMDRNGFIIAGCRLGNVHMGRYRENLIRAALKSNESTPLSSGIIGFSPKSSQLILFIKLNPNTITVHQITTLLPLFLAKTKLWTDAITKGEVPEILSSTPSKTTGIFDLIS